MARQIDQRQSLGIDADHRTMLVPGAEYRALSTAAVRQTKMVDRGAMSVAVDHAVYRVALQGGADRLLIDVHDGHRLGAIAACALLTHTGGDLQA